MAERVDGNRGFANLQVFDENTNYTIKAAEKHEFAPEKKNPQPPQFTTKLARESKLSMKSVKSIIKAVVLLSKTGENVASVNKVVRITLQKQWFEKKL